MAEEFRLQIKVRNNRLMKAREQLGMSPKQFAAAVGMSYGQYLAYEGLKMDPFRAGGRGLRETAERICEFHQLSADYFWPEAVRAVVKPQLEAEISAPALQQLSAGASEANRAFILHMLRSLSPREEKVIRMRFGIDEDERTLLDVGRDFEVSSERIRGIEAKALRKLRHPSRKAAALAVVDTMCVPEDATILHDLAEAQDELRIGKKTGERKRAEKRQEEWKIVEIVEKGGALGYVFSSDDVVAMRAFARSVFNNVYRYRDVAGEIVVVCSDETERWLCAYCIRSAMWRGWYKGMTDWTIKTAYAVQVRLDIKAPVGVASGASAS